MNINRSNYEIWFIDWLDGKLSNPQLEQLMQFIEQNPDLKEEFEGLNSINLQPNATKFKDKELLFKSSLDLTPSQFEYLCVAYLENDLSAEQRNEVKEITENDPGKRKTFELIQNIKLAPAAISFKNKNKLFKRTPLQKTIRLSIIGFSAAAAIAIMIMIYFTIPYNPSDNIDNIATNIVVDNKHKNTEINNIPERIVSENIPALSSGKRAKQPPVIKQMNYAMKESESNATSSVDSSVINTRVSESAYIKVTFRADIGLGAAVISNTLIKSKATVTVPEIEDERGRLSRFIAKTFREKILKEKSSADTPLRGYEIAEAGVTGLNKLLGWEMELDMNNYENGEPTSVYFSSKMLKFNAPVKKTAAQP